MDTTDTETPEEQVLQELEKRINEIAVEVAEDNYGVIQSPPSHRVWLRKSRAKYVDIP
jgi:hypothetical protein